MFEWLEHGFMIQALVATAAMGVLLAYLGIHVVGRGIVFVDLALGQISSMGVAFAMWAELDPVICSMAATLAAAALFSRLRVRDPRLRLEAVIGIFYAVSSAITVLLIAKTPHGDADIQDVLFGNVLALERSEVIRMLAVFAGVAVVHLILGRQFFALTYRKGSGETLSRRDHWLNFVFYVLLAFAIVFAIRTGGVIPVFAFLILPPVAALRSSGRSGVVIPVALALAFAGCFFGLDASFAFDLPAGASIVAVLGLLGLLLSAAAALWRRRGAGAAALVALALLGAAAPAAAQEAPATGDVAAVAGELSALKAEVAAAQARIAALEARLAALAAAPQPPPAGSSCSTCRSAGCSPPRRPTRPSRSCAISSSAVTIRRTGGSRCKTSR